MTAVTRDRLVPTPRTLRIHALAFVASTLLSASVSAQRSARHAFDELRELLGPPDVETMIELTSNGPRAHVGPVELRMPPDPNVRARNERTRTELEEPVRREPDSPMAQKNLGMALLLLDDQAAAWRRLSRAEELFSAKLLAEPNDVDSAIARAGCVMYLGRTSEGVETLERIAAEHESWRANEALASEYGRRAVNSFATTSWTELAYWQQRHDGAARAALANAPPSERARLEERELDHLDDLLTTAGIVAFGKRVPPIGMVEGWLSASRELASRAWDSQALDDDRRARLLTGQAQVVAVTAAIAARVPLWLAMQAPFAPTEAQQSEWRMQSLTAIRALVESRSDAEWAVERAALAQAVASVADSLPMLSTARESVRRHLSADDRAYIARLRDEAVRLRRKTTAPLAALPALGLLEVLDPQGDIGTFARESVDVGAALQQPGLDHATVAGTCLMLTALGRYGDALDAVRYLVRETALYREFLEGIRGVLRYELGDEVVGLDTEYWSSCLLWGAMIAGGRKGEPTDAELDQAQQLFGIAYRRKPDALATRLALGRHLVRIGAAPQEARQLLESVVKENLAEASAHVALAMLDVLDEQWPSAIEHARNACLIAPQKLGFIRTEALVSRAAAELWTDVDGARRRTLRFQSVERSLDFAEGVLADGPVPRGSTTEQELDAVTADATQLLSDMNAAAAAEPAIRWLRARSLALAATRTRAKGDPTGALDLANQAADLFESVAHEPRAGPTDWRALARVDAENAALDPSGKLLSAAIAAMERASALEGDRYPDDFLTLTTLLAAHGDLSRAAGTLAKALDAIRSTCAAGTAPEPCLLPLGFTQALAQLEAEAERKQDLDSFCALTRLRIRAFEQMATLEAGSTDSIFGLVHGLLRNNSPTTFDAKRAVELLEALLRRLWVAPYRVRCLLALARMRSDDFRGALAAVEWALENDTPGLATTVAPGEDPMLVVLGELDDRLRTAHDEALTAEAKRVRQGWARSDARREFALAREYLGGSLFPRDLGEGEYWLRRAAEHGDRDAQYALGREGTSLGVDAGERAAWLRKAALNGHVRACVEHAFTLLEPALGRDEHGPVLQEAASFLEVACASGDSEGCSLLGQILLWNDDRSQWPRGVQLLELALGAGEAKAAIVLARSIATGSGTERDEVRARKLLESTATGKDADVMEELARFYEFGIGGPKDPVAAAKLRAELRR